MNFDVIQFLTERGIEHRVGPAKNVKAGWVGVDCVFCGDDSGKHLGINLSNGHYACWRNNAHRGAIAYLVAHILRCSINDAKKVTGEKSAPTPGGHSWAELAALAAPKQATSIVKPVKLLPEFKPLLGNAGGAKRFFDYLVSRRFNPADLPAFCRRFHIHYALTGEFAYRLIFPVFDGSGVLRGWQGRPIGKAETRYMSYPSGPDLKQYLFNGNELSQGGKNLWVVEGPVDCYKGAFYGGKDNRFTATMGVGYSPAQVGQLYRVAPKFENRFVLFDKGAYSAAMALCGELAKFSFKAVEIPPGREDTGALFPVEVKPVLAALAAGRPYRFA